MMRRREHQLRRRSNKEVRAALKSLSEQQHVLKTAQSTQEIEQALAYHQKNSDETSLVQTRSIRTSTCAAPSQLAESARSRQRYSHKEHEHEHQGHNHKEHEHDLDQDQGHNHEEHEHELDHGHNRNDHKQATGDITIFLYGAAGTGVGSEFADTHGEKNNSGQGQDRAPAWRGPLYQQALPAGGPRLDYPTSGYQCSPVYRHVRNIQVSPSRTIPPVLKGPAPTTNIHQRQHPGAKTLYALNIRPDGCNGGSRGITGDLVNYPLQYAYSTDAHHQRG
ncbi:unnamed protein product [Mortierella alpina]